MAAAEISPEDWLLFRRQMPVTAKWSYFDNAAVAPLPQPVRDAVQGWLDQAVQEGDTVWGEWSRALERTRALAADLINASPTEIALVANTTTGVGIVAEGLPWQPGDNVVTLANEFPTNQYPWMNLVSRGVQTRRVPPAGPAVDLARLADAIDSNTRLVSVSWVGFATGWRLDLDEVAQVVHSRGALLFVDAIQGLGVFPLDVRRTPIDFLAADGHKWMLGPEGAGILYIRQEQLERLRPTGVGWHSVVHSSDYSRIELQLRPTAARFEGGSHNMAGFLGLGASLQLLQSFGLSPHSTTIADRVLQLTDLACERLADGGAQINSLRESHHRSGIVSFQFPGRDSQEVRRRCLERGVALACRGGALRISPHAYANEEDVDRLVAACGE